MSAAPTLLLPSHLAEGRETVPKAKPSPGGFFGGNDFLRRAWNTARGGRKVSAWKLTGPDPIAHPGRGYGEPVGVWIDGLVARRKVIVLCVGCMSKFFYKRVHYY